MTPIRRSRTFWRPARAFADLTRATFGDTSLGPAAIMFFRGIAAGAEIVLPRQPHP